MGRLHRANPFSEYSARYSAFFRMRREGSILEARLHTKDGPYVHTAAAHSAWARVWQVIGNDPDNHKRETGGKQGQTTVSSVIQFEFLNLPPNNSPDSGSGFFRGRPGWPGCARRPITAATSVAKRSLPSTKLPFVARRIWSTTPGSNS